jgi:hypothetical protein
MMAVAYWAMDQVTAFLLKHWEYVLGYICVTGFLSFAAMYCWGGVNNPKTFDIIRWGLQLLAVMIVFLCAASFQASTLLVAVALLTYNIPMR